MLPNEYILDTTSQTNDKQVANIYAKLIVTLVQTGTIPMGSSGTYGWQQYTPQSPNYLVFPKVASNPVAIQATQSINGYRTAYSDFFNGFIYELQDKTTRCLNNSSESKPEDHIDSNNVGTSSSFVWVWFGLGWVWFWFGSEFRNCLVLLNF